MVWKILIFFFFKYITKENGKLYLACVFCFYCSKLEEEEKKNNGKEEKEKVDAEKVKREAVQVVVSDRHSHVNISFSLGKTHAASS